MQLLLTGCVETAREAERLYLEEHLDDVVALVNSSVSDEEFRKHFLIGILLSHGSRGWDDSVL